MRTGSPVQVYLTPELKERLETLARYNMRTMSAEMVIALRKHLEQSAVPDEPAVKPSAPAAQAEAPAGSTRGEAEGKAAKKTRKREG